MERSEFNIGPRHPSWLTLDARRELLERLAELRSMRKQTRSLNPAGSGHRQFENLMEAFDRLDAELGDMQRIHMRYMIVHLTGILMQNTSMEASTTYLGIRNAMQGFLSEDLHKVGIVPETSDDNVLAYEAYNDMLEYLGEAGQGAS